MKRQYITILLFLLLSMLGVEAFAHDIEAKNSQGVTIYYSFYNLSNKTELAVSYRGSSSNDYSNEYTGNVIIPESVYYQGTTYPVTRINSWAFGNCSELTSVTIPNSVTVISNGAFQNCSNITSVTFPNSLTSIGDMAFWKCICLTSINIPNSVTSIGSSAFDYTGIYNNAPDGVFYVDNWVCGYKGNMPNNTTLTLAEDTRGIGGEAFAHSIGLVGVIIPNSVTVIDYYAFYCCSNLTSVIIPNSVNSIGSSAFYGCSNLINITIPNSVIFISDKAFNNTGIYNNAPDGVFYVDNWVCGYKGNMPNNTTLTLAEDTRGISVSAFSHCKAMTSVIIPNSVLFINTYAFANCSNLTSVIIGNSVNTIGTGSFMNCSSLTNLTIGNSVNTIGPGSFTNCYRLQTICSLNTTPPTCQNMDFFECSNYNNRDIYDVYTYANLHVPMGSGEVYSSAYGWRYFNKIQEDMEADGRVYYANLTVKQGTTGFTRQAVKAAETYTIYISSLGENKVNAVIFNGKDVTDMVVNGYYTTPEIKGESILSISYETPSEVRSMTLNNVKVTGYDSEIHISQIDEPSDVLVYSIDGKLIGNIPSAFGSVCLQVPSEQLYVVKVGNRTYKVAL